MHFSSRVLSQLERGLIGQLRFSFQGLGTSDLQNLRVGDPIRLEIRVHNESGLPLTELRGTLRHGPRARFPAVTFTLDRLGPCDSELIATVEGVFHGPASRQIVDAGLCSVAVSTRIDLSHVLFEEWDRAVVLAPEASSPELPVPRPMRRAIFGKGLPLSTT